MSGHGYVGLGRVLAEAVPARDFRIGGKALQDLSLKASNITHDSEDLEKCEYVVRIKWFIAKKREEALWKQGLFSTPQTRVSVQHLKTLHYIENQWGIRFEDILDQDES